MYELVNPNAIVLSNYLGECPVNSPLILPMQLDRIDMEGKTQIIPKN